MKSRFDYFIGFGLGYGWGISLFDLFAGNFLLGIVGLIIFSLGIIGRFRNIKYYHSDRRKYLSRYADRVRSSQKSLAKSFIEK